MISALVYYCKQLGKDIEEILGFLTRDAGVIMFTNNRFRVAHCQGRQGETPVLPDMVGDGGMPQDIVWPGFQQPSLGADDIELLAHGFETCQATLLTPLEPS